MLNPPVALITDFGAGSYHVGTMKSVIHKIFPECAIIDITHDVTPFNIVEAMYILDAVHPYCPVPTIFLIVVDPGVGSERRPILAVGENNYYICPDNGVISRVLQSDSVSRVIHIDEEHYMLPNPGFTFHGRDVFAPCAAWLSKLMGADRFGEAIDDYSVLETPKVKIIADRTLQLPILFVDHFGNLVTNFEHAFFEKARDKFPGRSIQIKAGNATIHSLSRYYSENTSIGDPVAYFGSMNLLEIGVRERNANKLLGLAAGDCITLYLGE